MSLSCTVSTGVSENSAGSATVCACLNAVDAAKRGDGLERHARLPCRLRQRRIALREDGTAAEAADGAPRVRLARARAAREQQHAVGLDRLRQPRQPRSPNNP